MISKVGLMTEDGKIERRSFKLPELQTGDLLLQTIYSEVCGTDVHLKHARLAGVPYPIIPGHVSVGTIAQLEGEVKDVNGDELIVGDRVTFLDVAETCQNCYYCLVAKASTRCPKRKVYGITYGINDGLKGGWSQYIYLPKGVKVIKLPEHLDAKTFIAAGCGLPTALHAIERAEIKLGSTVLVQGAGPVGLMCATLAKLSGAFEVIMIGAPEHRLKIARSFGVDHTINIETYNAEKRLERVLALTQRRGSDISIEATGNPIAVREGMQLTRDQGRYVIVGQYTDAGDISINPHNDINKKHLEIRGCWGSDYSHFDLAVRFVAKYGGKYPFEKIISKIYSLEELELALEDVEQLKVMKAVISPNKET